MNQKIKSEFPILAQKVNGKPLIYMDNAATTQKPKTVLEAIAEFYLTANANVHRGIYALSARATALFEYSREQIAAFVGARESAEIIFTRNATEGLNLIAYAWGRTHIKKGDEILITEMEHHANFVPWLELAKEKNATVRFIPITPDGLLETKKIQTHVTKKTKIVAFTHISNVLGTINPVSDIVRRVRQKNKTCVIILDAAQSVGHMTVNVQTLGVDFLAFSGHKMYGPSGIGVLWGRKDLLEAMPPFLTGGEMIREVTKHGATWNDLPWKFEAGTPHSVGAVGLAAACAFLNEIGLAAVRTHERELTTYCLQSLQALDWILIYGPVTIEGRSGIISFNVKGVHAHDVASILDEHGIAIRSGHHCAMPLMKILNVPATCRVSFGVYNTLQDVRSFLGALRIVRRIFHGKR